MSGNDNIFILLIIMVVQVPDIIISLAYHHAHNIRAPSPHHRTPAARGPGGGSGPRAPRRRRARAAERPGPPARTQADRDARTHPRAHSPARARSAGRGPHPPPNSEISGPADGHARAAAPRRRQKDSDSTLPPPPARPITLSPSLSGTPRRPAARAQEATHRLAALHFVI